MVSFKIIVIAIVLGSILNNFFILNAQEEIAPSTLGQPSYPSSGPTRNRSDVMGGISSASKASKGGQALPKRQEEQEKKTDESFKRGPYDQKGEYQHVSPDE